MIEIRISENTAAEDMAVYEELTKSETIFQRLDALEAAVDDTGWRDLNLENGVQAYATGNKPQYRRIGKVVFLRGAVTNVNARNTVIATLPEGFRPSTMSYPYVQNTSLRIGDFMMLSRIIAGTNGQIKIEALSDGASFGAKWFPINCCFVIG